jgi:hypothetical protein
MHGVFNPGPPPDGEFHNLCDETFYSCRFVQDTLQLAALITIARVTLSVFSLANHYSTAEGDVIASSRYCEINGTIANNPAPIEKSD